MSEVIKVHDIPGLERYAKSIQEFSKNVEAAASETERQFNAKTGNGSDKGLAITAFFERLNVLQTQVFHTFPNYLTSFAGKILHFENGVSEAGFSKEVWTSGTGVEELGQKLVGEGADSQLYLVKEKIKDLKSLLDAATSALGIENESLEATKSAAEDSLTSAKSARETTHEQVQSAHDTFNTALFDVLSDLMSLNNQIEVCKAKMAVAPDVVMAAIHNQTLTSDKMYYIDAIQSQTDAKIMTVILKEKDDKPAFFKELANVKTEGASLEVSQVIVERLMKEIDHAESDGSVPNLSIFMEALTQRDQKSVKDYALRLSKASESLAVGYKVQVDSIIPEFPPPGSPSEAYTEYFNKKNSKEVQAALRALNNKVEWYEKMNSLFMYAAMNEMGVGKSVTLQNPKANGGFEKQFYTPKTSFQENSIKLTKSQDGRGFAFSVSSNIGTTGVKADIIDEKTGLNIAENSNKIRELNAEKSILFASTVVNTAKDLGKLYAPSGAMISIIETGMNADEDIKKGLDLTDTAVGEVGGMKSQSSMKIAQNIYDYFDKTDAYNEEIKSLMKENEAEFWQYGGTSFTHDNVFKGSSQYISPSYDVAAYLKQKDLEQNGLRNYIYEEAYRDGQNAEEATNRLRAFENAIKVSETNEIYTDKIKDLLSGGRRYSLDQIGHDALYDGLGKAQDQIKPTESTDGSSSTRFGNNPSFFTRDSYQNWSYLKYVTGVGEGGQ